jgi:branched-subunit amino acid transport protein
MSVSTTYLVVAICGLTTVVTRSSFFVLPARFTLPAKVERALRYAPACALAAIVAPGVVTKNGDLTIGWGNHELWAVLVAALVFVRTRNMLVMMAAGMALFTVLRLWA